MEQPPQYDFDRICRTCKGESTVVRSVFETFENVDSTTHIHEMLMACAAVQVGYDDGLPSFMCEKCVQKLQAAYFFKKQCEASDTSLREYAKTMKENDIKPSVSSGDVDQNNYIEKFLLENSGKEPDPETRTDYIELLDNNQMVLTCRECGKVFTTLEGLRCHKRLHTGALFKCKYCDKEYTRQNHLQRHELSHNRRKVHVCRICSKTLTRLEHLKRHLTTHLKEKPFSCTRCKRGFNRSEHLENHVARCKGDRIHICDICNKGFNRADSLEVHKLLHENQKPVLPTLENLDNIEDHYFEIDYDDNTAFSDDNSNEVEECFEPHVEVTESTDEKISEEMVEVDTKPKEEISEEMKTEDMLEGTSRDDTIDNDIIMSDGDVRENENDNDNGDLEQLLKEENQEDGEDRDNETEEEFEDDKLDMSEDIIDDIADRDDPASDSGGSEYTPPTKTRKRGRPRKHPPKSPKSPKGKKSAKKIKKEDEEYGDFPCPECQEIFPLMTLLEKHAVELHPGVKIYKCEECTKSFSRSNHLKRHLLSHSKDKPHICEICTKSFNRKDHLTQHLKLHLKASDEVCDICLKPFHRADHLAKHKASKHGVGQKVVSEKKYECDICQKSFTTEKYRDVHVKGHQGIKKYPCKVCDKTFLSKSHLNEHQKFHNEHCKKFLCSECGQRFIRNDYLVIHMRRHRGEKPFKCKYCGKGFPRTTDLTVHERYHTGEKTHLCTICGRGFGRAYNLTVHMRTHTGEKPYQCTYCDAAFAQGNDLKAHVRRHTGERFQCELCTESFLMGYLLTHHKRTVHGLNVVSNIRRLQPISKLNPEDPNEPPPITIPLPKPVIPDNLLNNMQAPMATLTPLGALSFAQLQHHMVPE